MSDVAEYEWWFGDDNLSIKSVNEQREWQKHPFDALEVGDGLTLYRRDRAGQIDHSDAAVLLTAFGCYEAFKVAHLWNIPEIAAMYLETGDVRISELAKVMIQAALEQAHEVLQSATDAVKIAEARCPKKVRLFSRSSARVATLNSIEDFARAIAAHHHAGAVVHAVTAALFATIRGTCETARFIAEQTVKAAGLVAAEEGVILAINDHRPELAEHNSARSKGELTALAATRTRFLDAAERLFSRAGS